jgi:hypothetical protein
MRGQFLSLAAVAFGFLSLACEAGGVGDPCTPEDEYNQTFSGYKETEVNVESRSFQCETRVCLVNHFRGRVSCPYGQTAADTPTFDQNGQQVSGLPPTDPKVCRIPGTTGALATDAIVVPVPAQLYNRTATASPDRTGTGEVDDAVYCSCRCKNSAGNTDDGARYCECPSGFTCSKLIDDVGLGSSELAGSYCIRDGTQFVTGSQGESCAGSNCGNNGNNP